MTSRRGFLGALMALPIAAPTIAKELATSHLASGGFVRGAAKLQTLTLTLDATEFRKALDETVSNPELRDLMRSKSVFEKPEPRTPHYGWAVPNRLYGAEINHEGEAI